MTDAVPYEDAWTDDRRALLVSISGRSSVLGELYFEAVNTMDKHQWSMAKLINVAHDVREICNCLPDFLGDTSGLPPRSDIEQPTRRLAETWTAFESHLGPPSPAAHMGTVEQAVMEPISWTSVPTTLVESAAAVVAASLHAGDSARQRRGALVSGPANQYGASLRVFRESQRFFERFAHFSRIDNRPLPDFDTAMVNFERIETVIAARIRRFTETASTVVDRLLAAANAKATGS